MWHMPPCPAPTRWQTQVSVGAYSVCVCVFFSPDYVALWDSTTPHIHSCEWISYCVETSPPSWLPPQGRSLSLNLLSLLLSFIFCPTSFWRNWAAFMGVWCPLVSIQKLFCGSCSGFKWSADEFVGEKVVSLSYSSTILGLPPEHSHFKQMFSWHETKVKLT